MDLWGQDANEVKPQELGRWLLTWKQWPGGQGILEVRSAGGEKGNWIRESPQKREHGKYCRLSFEDSKALAEEKGQAINKHAFKAMKPAPNKLDI